MRSSLLGIVLGLGLVAATPAPGAPPRTDVCARFAPLPVAFRFHAGTAPVGAAVARDGGVYVGTVDGYVHALRADGSYRWSYTLPGPVVGRPVVGESGALFVATPRRVVALRPDGTLLWVFRSPVRIAGDLARDREGRVHFASPDGRLFALSGRGALVAHVPGRTAFSAGPLTLPDGSVAAGRSDGGVVVSAGARVTRFSLGAAVSAVLGCPGARLCALAGGALHALGEPEADFHVSATAAAASDGFLAVLARDTELALFSGPERAARYRVTLPETASAAPAVDASGRAYVALASGAVLAFDAAGTPRACAELGPSTLGAPLLDAAGRRLIVLSREGLVASLGLE